MADELPEWVIRVWLPNAGTVPIIRVPQALRDYAEAHGMDRREGESLNAWTIRLRGAILGIGPRVSDWLGPVEE